MIWNAGFDEIRFSSERYDTFSDAPQASSAEEFGTQGVNVWAVKPIGKRRGQPPVPVIEDRRDSVISEGELDSLPEPDEIYDAGSLGCGDGPLTTIAGMLRRMPGGSVLEVRSTDPGVIADLPAWCRMVGHTYLGGGRGVYNGRFLVRRKEV